MDDNCFANIFNKMADQKSLELIDSKLRSWSSDQNSLIKYMATDENEWKLSDYDQFLPRMHKGQFLTVYGTTSECLMTCVILAQMQVRVDMLCLTDFEEEFKSFTQMYSCISVTKLISDYRDSFVVIASRKCGSQLYAKLIGEYFPRDNVFLPRTGLLYATTGFQYFDCPYIQPGENEVFVDCGAFDALNSKQFAEWCGNKYERIVAFEPSSGMYDSIKKTVKLPRFEIYGVATGADKHEAFFSDDESTGSMVVKSGGNKVQVDSIDNILNGGYCSFIKMDVEGAELDTLKGAVNTIKNYKPRLAICIYHKPSDIGEILPFIESIRNDYKYCVRHYTSCDWETVLYAF